jgi:hypothetical protein
LLILDIKWKKKVPKCRYNENMDDFPVKVKMSPEIIKTNFKRMILLNHVVTVALSIVGTSATIPVAFLQFHF